MLLHILEAKNLKRKNPKEFMVENVVIHAASFNDAIFDMVIMTVSIVQAHKKLFDIRALKFGESVF